jgi:hypothetical protein
VRPADQEPAEVPTAPTDQGTSEDGVRFILYLDGVEYDQALSQLAVWVGHFLLPVYGREVTSQAPWCPEWWRHKDAVALLYALWMAWFELSQPSAGLTGPAIWHRDHLAHTMAQLRDPSGTFAGCKPGNHREKAFPVSDFV